MSFVSKPCAARALALAPALLIAACSSPAEEADEPARAPGELAEAPGTSTSTSTSSQPPAATATASPGDEAGTPGEPAAAETSTTEPTPAASPTPAAARATPAAATVAVAATAPPMWAVCGACHAVEPGQHGLGPSLAGVFNARAASKPGFDYSEAMASSGLTWNQATLDRYLTDPRATVPGTTMAFAGLKNDAQRAEVIEYLKGL